MSRPKKPKQTYTPTAYPVLPALTLPLEEGTVLGKLESESLPAPDFDPDEITETLFSKLPYTYTPADFKFIFHFLRTGSPTESAIAAYPHYSRVTAGRRGYQILNVPRIRQAIQVAQERLAVDLYRDTEWNKARIIQELSGIATASVDDVLSWTANGADLRPTELVPEPARKAIKKIRVNRKRLVTGRPPNQEEWEIETLEIQMHDKLAALNLIGKELGMFVSRVIHSDDDMEELRQLAEEAGVPLELAAETFRALSARSVNQK